ncbi:MAG: acetoacetate--CoA ligase [Burkholderiaceae bacterium]|nr:acetoacetate--CoA ligase [Burkholderiaceae bacterium]
MTLPIPHITRYQDWLARTRGLHFDGYDALWQWSVTELDAFWLSIWDYFELRSATPFELALCEEKMPGARWFEGASLNYAAQVLRHADAAQAAGHPAIVWANEAMLAQGASGALGELSWPELRRQVGALAASLQRLGVQRGDRVVAYLPNIPQTVVAFLAVASLGAIWSVCSPDMGPVAVLDRFAQIEPKALITVDGYAYGGQGFDRMPLLRQLLAALPSVRDVVLLPCLDAQAEAQLLAGPARAAHAFADLVAPGLPLLAPEPMPFDHPLWIVYSSGTTGLPKPIVHGHGGVVLEALKMGTLHNNLGASAQDGDRFHWYSSTGWIMWNCQIAGLLGGTTICLFDGNPGGTREHPDWSTLWRFAARAGVTFFGAGAAFYASCLKAGVRPQQGADLSRLRAVGSTGSPLADECYDWIWSSLPQVEGRPIWIACIAGGTDFAGAFLAGVPTLPVHRGQMQCRCLGASVQAFGEPDAQGRGQVLIDEVGELVCTRPMPSMPLMFWNDPCNTRYLESYFDMYRGERGEGIWRHGDWLKITPEGGAIIYGRSDATINRHGIRMGTAELYRAVEALPEVLDSLVVDLEYLGRDSYMPLFVVLREGLVLDEALTRRLREAIKQALSARHVPNEIFQVAAIPRTLSGKKMELPVKKLLQGASADAVLKRDAMANAECVDWFVAFAAQRAGL